MLFTRLFDRKRWWSPVISNRISSIPYVRCGYIYILSYAAYLLCRLWQCRCGTFKCQFVIYEHNWMFINTHDFIEHRICECKLKIHYFNLRMCVAAWICAALTIWNEIKIKIVKQKLYMYKVAILLFLSLCII